MTFYMFMSFNPCAVLLEDCATRLGISSFIPFETIRKDIFAKLIFVANDGGLNILKTTLL